MTQMTQMKPGWKSSEFWFTAASFIFSGLYLAGALVDNEQKENLTEITSHAVESCILIGGQLLILYKYVSGRNKIKQKYQDIQEEKILAKGTENERPNTNTKPKPKPKPRKKTPTKPRTR